MSTKRALTNTRKDTNVSAVRNVPMHSRNSEVEKHNERIGKKVKEYWRTWHYNLAVRNYVPEYQDHEGLQRRTYLEQKG